jgi:hypothetical protein
MPRHSQKISGTTRSIAENRQLQKAKSDSFGRAKKGAKTRQRERPKKAKNKAKMRVENKPNRPA